MTKLRLIMLIVLFGVGGYLWVKGPEGLKLPGVLEVAEVAEVSRVAEPAPISAQQKLQSGEVAEDGTVKVHYFTKEGLAACSTETVTRPVEPDPKYGHAGAGALVAQTLTLPLEAREQYVSALAPATRLRSMKISPEGVATADYNAALNTELNDCNKPQRKAQIERTLKEFEEVKEVVITVDGKVWE